jgi:hypothetical protein
MRNTGWKITALIIVVLLTGSSAFTQGLSGWFDITNSTSKKFEDGDKTLETETLNHNLYLNFQKSITSMLSYEVNLRTNFSDSDLTVSDEDTTKDYLTSIEPSIDFLFGNPMYGLSGGYRHQEQWTTALLTNDSKTTTEFYYSRFNLSPQALPSLNIQFDKKKRFDHLDDMELDNSDTSYSAGSAYTLPSRDVKLRYNLNYSRIINRTPLSTTTSKTVNDNFNGNYNIGYTGLFWNNNVTYSASYQGNFSRNKTEQFVIQTDTVLNKRTPLAGLYALNPNPDTGEVNTENNLINNDYNTAIASINIGTGMNHNIGIWVPIQSSIDRLYIYVNENVSNDTNLQSTSNWRLYKSNSNVPGTTWTNISTNINKVVITADTLNNIYRYEIVFSTPQSASYFKVVNLNTVNAIGLGDVFVTEIEAYGTDFLDEVIDTTVTTTFTQGVNLSTGVKLMTKLNFLLHYTLNRTDENPISTSKSIGGIFENIYSDSVSGEKSDFTSNIRRNYGVSSTWLTHRLLTTTFRVQRNESFDNKEETDISYNTYNISFNSAPLPSLDTNLSLIRSDSFTFNEKDTINNSLLLSIGSKLYRDVNMITDIGYTRSKSFINETSSSSRQIAGNIDAL